MAMVPTSHRCWNGVFAAAFRIARFFVSWRCPEAQSAQFFAIQTHLSHRFNLAVDFLGLRRNGSLSQIIDQAQDFLEQAARHRNFGQLERDIAAMADDLSPDPDQLLSWRRQRPTLD